MGNSEDTPVNEPEAAHGGNKISRKAQRQLRQLLLTAAVGGALIAVPQAARAVIETGSQTSTVTVTGANSAVTTDSTFSVNTNVGDALDISGAGAISYDDLLNNNSLITTDALGTGLTITSAGDILSGNTGSITVTSGGIISGGHNGILATNLLGTGGISVTTTGTVTGTAGTGIGVNAGATTTGAVTVTTSGTSPVSGGLFGIDVTNAGTGGISVITTGDVSGGAAAGIFVNNTNLLATGAVMVTTSGTGTVSGGFLELTSPTLALAPPALPLPTL